MDTYRTQPAFDSQDPGFQNPGAQSYPAQQAHPAQGYSQQPSYPAQGYPARQAYAAQAYPAQQAYAAQGYAAQSYPAQAYPAQQPSAQANPYATRSVKQPSGWARLWGAFGLAFLVVIIQTIAFLVGMMSHSNEGMLTVGEVAGGIAAMLFVLVMGGRKMATPSLEGMGETWRIVRWLFLADAVIAVIDMVSTIAEGSFELAELWPLRILMLVLMCAGIGLFEEATFRGLVFNGLLARMGTNKKGMFWAIVLSSLFFGVMHIDPTSVAWTDPSQILQVVLKVAQTGIFGFVAAVCVLETGNIWPIALVHGLNDFMLMFVYNGLMPEPVTTEYVSSGTDGLLAIGIYVALCVAYLPSLVVAYRTFLNHAAPDRGAFYRGSV